MDNYMRVLVVFIVLLLGTETVLASESNMAAVDENMRRLEIYMQQAPAPPMVVEERKVLASPPVERSSLANKRDLLQLLEKVSLTDGEKLELIGIILAK